ncbi:MAG: prolipoprotein diacylglyceryl transferase [Alphaproteobacteria bacterium]|nr:MAG: prolipoprotein diacylglyceryl transferase [Alphaproteobacteria bacterium]
MPLFAIPFPAVDPVLIELGPFAVHWYGVAYVAGILFGWWYARRLVADARLWGTRGAPMTPADLDDFLVWAVIGIVAGGRLGYVLFYDLPVYLDNPARILMVWTGGMSFHGGLAGTIVAMILFARRRGFSVFSLFDVIAASVGVGLFLGRLTNFINQELWGKPTDLPWGVIFPAAGPEPRHPSQLYEAVLEGLVLFLVLRLLTHRLVKLQLPGFVAGAFIAWYASCRILIEFVRLPDPQLGYLAFGWLTMGMLLSLPMLAAGIWAMATARSRGR